MKQKWNNCLKCIEYKNNKCEGEDVKCICYRCPRNIEKCMSIKYCTETESVLNL